MTGKKLYLIIQSALCVLLAILLAAAAVSVYREGTARRAEEPTAPIYTREAAAEKLRALAPLFFGALGMTAAGLLLGAKDARADKPLGDAGSPRRQSAEGRRAKRVLQVAVIAAALVFILLGVMNGSAKAVYTKAANICTECVGLG